MVNAKFSLGIGGTSEANFNGGDSNLFTLYYLYTENLTGCKNFSINDDVV